MGVNNGFCILSIAIAQWDVCPAVIKTPHGPVWYMSTPLQWGLKEFCLL